MTQTRKVVALTLLGAALVGCGAAPGGGTSNSDASGDRAVTGSSVFDGTAKYGDGEPGANGEPLCQTFGKVVLAIAEKRGHKGLAWRPLLGGAGHNPLTFEYPTDQGNIDSFGWVCDGALLPKDAPYPTSGIFHDIRATLYVAKDPDHTDFGEIFPCSTTLNESPPAEQDDTVPSAQAIADLNGRLAKSDEGSLAFCQSFVAAAPGPWVADLHVTGPINPDDTSAEGQLTADVGYQGYSAILVDWLNAIDFKGNALE